MEELVAAGDGDGERDHETDGEPELGRAHDGDDALRRPGGLLLIGGDGGIELLPDRQELRLEALPNGGAEGRCLVTLDLDFSNPFLFPPEDYAGIVVLRPRRLTPDELYATVNTFSRR